MSDAADSPQMAAPGAFLTEGAPDHAIPEDPMTRDRRDAPGRAGARRGGHSGAQPGHLRHHLDGARGAAGDRREPPSQLHRPRRVPPDLRDPAALHPDAGRAVPCAGRNHGHEHAGFLGGDHARSPVAEVEVAPAPRGRRQAHGRPESRLRRRRPRRLGEVLSLLRRGAADRAPAGGEVHDRPGGHRAARRREHDRRRGGGRHNLHRSRR